MAFNGFRRDMDVDERKLGMDRKISPE